MERAAYDFILDLFPLSEMVVDENRVIGEDIQRTALGLLLADNSGPGAQRLGVLIRLSRDLGYIDDVVARYLEKQLLKLHK
jgi:hypothetical protein